MRKTLLLLSLFSLGYAFSFAVIEYWGVDWFSTYLPVSNEILHPYQIQSFINPPWAVLMVSWASLLPRVSFSIQTGLLFLFIGWMVIRRSKSVWSLGLVLTSFPFVYNVYLGNIEWVIAIGFVLENHWGIPFLMIKPQSGIFAGLVWFLKSDKKIWFIAVGVLTTLLSFLIWGNWLPLLISNIEYVRAHGMEGWNISAFPYSLPVGIAMLFFIITTPRDERGRDTGMEFIAVLTSMFLSPYFGLQSLLIPFTLLCARSPGVGVLLWVLLWVLPFYKIP